MNLRRLSRVHGARLAIGAALALSSGAALAAPAAAPSFPACTQPPQVDLARAKDAHRVAQKAYDDGDYDKAIKAWREAYDADCTAVSLLINISDAYEKKGDWQGAIAALREYASRTGPNPALSMAIQALTAKHLPAPTRSAPISPSYPACAHAPSAADSDRARATLKAGLKAMDSGEYDRAAQYLHGAYAFDCTDHTILIHLARAHERKGDLPAAITALEVYLQRSGPDPAVTRRLQGLRERQAHKPPPEGR